jgi:hypothetical protein
MNRSIRILAAAFLAHSVARASDADLFARSGEYAEAARLYLDDVGKSTRFPEKPPGPCFSVKWVPSSA